MRNQTPTRIAAAVFALALILLGVNTSYSEIVASWKWGRVPYDLAFVANDIVVNNGNLTDSSGVSHGPRLARFSKNGVQQWIQSYPANSTPQRITSTQDGGVAVAGWKWTGTGSNYQATVWKFSSSGVLAWETAIGGAGLHLFFDVAEMPDGSLVAVGSSEGSFDGSSNRGGRDVIAAKLTSGGSLTWKTQEGGTGDDYFTAVDVSPTGEILAVGYSNGVFLGTSNQGGFDGIAVEFSSDGDVTRHATLATSQEDQFEDVLFYQTNLAIIVGSISGDRGLVARMNSGSFDWTYEAGTPPSDQFTRVAITPGGTVWVGGIIDTEMVLKEISTSGTVIRERKRPQSQGDIMGLGVDSDGEVWTAQYEGWVYGGVDNPVPAVSLEGPSTVFSVNRSATFTVSASVEGGSIASYEWDLDGDGTYETSGGTSQTTSWATLGDKTIGIRVTSESGIANTRQKTVRVVADPATAVLSASTTTALTGSSIVFDASGSFSGSGRAVTYKWDLDGDQTYELEGGGQVSKSWDTAGSYIVRVQVTTPDGLTDSTSVSVTTYLAPPAGEIGISINGGYPYTNTKNVTIDVVWPPFANGLRVSNDGGFRRNLTENRQLSEEYSWALDDRVKGQFTKIVYTRFNGLNIDSSRTYSDDIIFDNTVPAITLASAKLVRGPSVTARAENGVTLNSMTLSYMVLLRAKDNRSGIGSVQVSHKKSASGVIKRTFSKKLIVDVEASKPPKWLWVRVEDRAGNWSTWRKVKAS